MCAEKIQRLIQASILGMVMGFAGSGMYAAAFILQFSMMLTLVIAGLTGWCPGLIMLKKIFPSCEKETIVNVQETEVMSGKISQNVTEESIEEVEIIRVRKAKKSNRTL